MIGITDEDMQARKVQDGLKRNLLHLKGYFSRKKGYLSGVDVIYQNRMPTGFGGELRG